MKKTSGQTALILILLTAAALIFLAITLNWGRLAQTKSLLTIAADTAGTTLASDAASYGEMQKQTYLVNENKKTSLTGVLLGIIVLIISIVLTYFFPPAGAWLMAVAIAGMVMTFATIVLQLVWINPMISAMWNKLQQNQPAQQQFYEQGISTGLEGVVTDQVSITDYFDWNANGVFGKNYADTVSRFAVFYTDRLKMLNEPAISQVTFFYDQLGELINGETCGQNQSDNYTFGLTVNPACVAAGIDPFSSPPCTPNSGCTTPGINCITDPTNLACQENIPNGFQLNDACTDSNPASATYNPYCDPCCQPVSVVNPLYCSPSTSGGGGPSTTCTGTTSTGAPCNCNPLVPQYISMRPSNCDQSASPPQCSTNNPYLTAAGGPYTLIYDPAFQEYNNNLSFLDMMGRDQQTLPAPPPPGQTTLAMSPDLMTPSTVTPPLEFPNGVFPFFWLMNEYSAEVDNINASTLTPDQYHWCTAAVLPGGVTYTPPAGFTDLAELTLPYTCVGQDCCVNSITNTLNSNGSVNSSPITITIVNGPKVNMTSPIPSPSYFLPGASITISASASETGGSISNVSLYDPGSGLILSCNASSCSINETAKNVGPVQAYAEATDANGVMSKSSTITVNVIQSPTVSITAPAQGATPKAGSAVTITAAASAPQPGDSVSSVAFYNNGTLLGIVSSSPYNYAWTAPSPSGTGYSLTAVVTDSYGLTVTSSPPVTGTSS
jgi:Bacterial Ig domain